MSLEPALGALKRLQSLGRYDFNRSEGESLRLIHAQWLGFGAMVREIGSLASDAGSGDVYARLRQRA